MASRAPTPAQLSIVGLKDIPLVAPGMDLAALVADGYAATAMTPEDGDVVVVAQKIVSKSEGRLVALEGVVPSPRAVELGRETGKDPRMIELVLAESTEVVRHRLGVIITAHRLGFVMANAGIDVSNVGAGEPQALLLPEDPDRTCRALSAALGERFGVAVAVIINDSLGRPWRLGNVGIALGAAGIPTLLDLRGNPDLFGRPLEISEEAVADELASAAGLVMGQGDEGRPIVVIRGYGGLSERARAADLIRPREIDLFR